MGAGFEFLIDLTNINYLMGKEKSQLSVAMS